MADNILTMFYIDEKNDKKKRLHRMNYFFAAFKNDVYDKGYSTFDAADIPHNEDLLMIHTDLRVVECIAMYMYCITPSELAKRSMYDKRQILAVFASGMFEYDEAVKYPLHKDRGCFLDFLRARKGSVRTV